MNWLTHGLATFWAAFVRLLRFRLVGFKTFLVISLVAVTIAGLNVAQANPTAGRLNKIVDIYDSGQLRSVPTRAETVGQLLERLGIILQADDIVEPALDSSLDQSNFQINIYRARPIRIIDGQETKTIRSAYQEPRLIVTAAGYELAANDIATWLQSSLLPDPSSPLDTIQISRATPIETATVPIPFQVILTVDGHLPTCYFQTVSFGQVGSKLVTYEVLDWDSSTEEPLVISEEIITEPVAEQQVRGGVQANFIAEADRQALVAVAGVAAADWVYLNHIFTKESRWNAAACNPSSKAFGLCQALPASKMAEIAGDYWTNPLTQVKWCHQYAINRYGSWQNAYSFWQANLWW